MSRADSRQHEIYLGLGSNIDAERNLQLAVRELRRHFGDLDVSRVYRNAPVGFSGDDFLNAVVRVHSELEPRDVLEVLAEIHGAAGRSPGKRKFAPRALDVDLLLYDRLVTNDPFLRLPRSDVLSYSFVLRPLAELAPDYVHPETGRTMREHWEAFDAASHPLAEAPIELSG